MVISSPDKNMKRYIYLLIILSLFSRNFLHAGTSDFPQLYKQLEQVLALRQATALHKEARIDSLQQTIRPGMSASTLYQLYGQIFEEYYVYRSDSALFYVDQAEKMAIRSMIFKNNSSVSSTVLCCLQLQATSHKPLSSSMKSIAHRSIQPCC